MWEYISKCENSLFHHSHFLPVLGVEQSLSEPTLKLILRSETEFLADEHVLPIKANIVVRNSSVMYHLLEFVFMYGLQKQMIFSLRKV